MARRIALDLKKRILELLKRRDRSIRELETKVNTNHNTIIAQLKELEFFDAIEIIKIKKNPKTGRPSTSIKITGKGRELI